MIRCPNCTAQLEFDAKSQKVTCDYCGSTFNPQEIKIEAKKAKATKSKETFEGQSYTCSQCGATLLTFDETAITFCSYCGSQAMIESQLIEKNNPQFIIPFKKTKEECIAAYKSKIAKSFFTPKYMKSDITINKFRGIYIPYCIYKLSFHDNSKNKGSKYSHRSGDYIYYDDYEVTARVDADYDGISYDMISNLYDDFTHSIPHNFHEAVPFNVNYLSGFYADTGDVGDEIYEDNAIKIADDDSTNHLLKVKEYHKYGCTKPQVHFQVSEKKIGMFPLYFLAIRDKSDKNVHYAIVNGQTGKIAVDLPVDFTKYIIISLILAIPLFFLINTSFVIVPKTVCIFSIIAAVISMIISIFQLNNLKKRETHENDEGFMYNSKFEKKKAKFKFQYILKQIIGIVFGIYVMIMNFVNDEYYYGASIIILCLVILSFYDLVKEHNLLTSNKLPQLEKRGGSENE